MKINHIKFIENDEQLQEVMLLIEQAHASEDTIESLPASLYEAVTDYMERICEQARQNLKEDPTNRELQNCFAQMSITVQEAKQFLKYV